MSGGPNRTLGPGLIAGLFIGLLVGLLLGIHWCWSLAGYYDVMLVVEDATTSKVLTRDGVYVGSLTFAGLAIFGFTILGKALVIGRGDTRKQNLGSFLVISGTLFIIVLYVCFAFQLVLFSALLMGIATVVAVIVIMAGAVLLAPKRKGPSNVGQVGLSTL